MTAPAFTGYSDPAVRRTGVGGTDVAKILGVSRFGSRFDVWAEKRGLSAPLIETEPMRWGIRLENEVARYWSEVTGVKIRRVNRTLRHPTQFFKYAHLDRRTPDAILEVKTAGVFAANDFGEQDTDEVPADYALQAHHYMHVTGLPRVHFAVLVGGQSFRKYVVTRDLEIEVPVEEEVTRFWHDNVEKGIPPDIDASESASRYLFDRHPRVLVPSIQMTDEIEAEAMEYDVARREVRQWETQKELRANRLRALLGDAAEAAKPGIVVRWSETAGAARLDIDALRAAHPAIAAEFTKQGDPGRRLTVNVKEQ